MTKTKDLRGSLSKTDQQRHFPELFGGKGDRPRIAGRLNNNNNSPAYQDGWERIFGGKRGED